jgi:hypothetical protein
MPHFQRRSVIPGGRGVFSAFPTASDQRGQSAKTKVYEGIPQIIPTTAGYDEDGQGGVWCRRAEHGGSDALSPASKTNACCGEEGGL